MTVNEVINYLHNKNESEKLQMKLALHCAPLFAGIKASNCLILSRSECRLLQNFLKQDNLFIWYLCSYEDKNLILLYRKDKLEQLLKQQKIRSYLVKEGYTNLSLTKVLIRLSMRMKAYREKHGKGQNAEFPHEIGIILGYPVNDVTEFIKNSGKNEIINGYWKVYQDAETAKMIFESYDKAKEEAVKLILSGFHMGHMLNN